MTTKASDLPNQLQQALLAQVRQQVGSQKYQEIVDAVGEDALLDFALGQMKAGDTSTTAAPKESWWKEAMPVVLFWGSMFVFTALLGPEVGQAIFWTVWIFIQLFPLVASFVDWIHEALGGDRDMLGRHRSRSESVWIAVGILVVVGGALAGVVFGVLKGGPWVAAGVGGWWRWLGGHF